MTRRSRDSVTSEEPVRKVRKSRSGTPSTNLKTKTERLQRSTSITTREFEKLVRSTIPPQEQDYIDEYIHMFRALKRMARQAERRCLSSGSSRDYYAYCTLLAQLREVIADIRTMSDLSNQSQLIVENVLQPMSQSIGQGVVNVFYQLKRLLRETSVPEETQFALSKLEELTKEQSKLLQHAYVTAHNALSKIMGLDK